MKRFNKEWKKPLCKNKYIEAEIDFYHQCRHMPWHFGFGFDLMPGEIKLTIGIFIFQYTWHTDHAGLEIDMYLPELYVGFSIYDARHWDYENGKWE
jgi:hypothetical protein